MENIYLSPITKTPSAVLDLPGSKSIANRVLLLSAIASGKSILHNVPGVAEDVCLMLQALVALGVKVEHLDTVNGASSYAITGCDGQFPHVDATLFCGNSGTTIRFLTAALAFMKGNQYTLTGIERMYERPISDLVVALNLLGANVEYIQQDGFPPLMIKRFMDNQIANVSISGEVSSQFLTGLLMALPLLKRVITVSVEKGLISKPYVDITRALLAKYGYEITYNENNIYSLPQGQLRGIEYTIEPDASSASYFLALGAIRGRVRVNNLAQDSLQGDKNFAHVLKLMGADVRYYARAIEVSSTNKLKAIDINMQDMPDVAMTIAVMALFAHGTTTITGIASWAVKETNRLQAMQNELSKLGAKVAITSDSIQVTPPDIINTNIEIETYNDHRMAMCFSLVAAYGVAVTIKDYQCVGKTFANYFDLFKQICY